MKETLMMHIEKLLKQELSNPFEKMIYGIAKLSLIAKPAAWGVRRVHNDDMLYLEHKGALNFLKNHGTDADYIYPLYTAFKLDTETDVSTNKVNL